MPFQTLCGNLQASRPLILHRNAKSLPLIKNLEAEKKKTAKAKNDLEVEKKKTAKVRGDLAKEQDLNRRTRRKFASTVKKSAGFGKKMVGRNVADATTSIIPVIGGFASVTFAVADVHAACELVAMQNELETALGIDSEPSNFKTYCIESINQINATATEAKTVG